VLLQNVRGRATVVSCLHVWRRQTPTSSCASTSTHCVMMSSTAPTARTRTALSACFTDWYDMPTSYTVCLGWIVWSIGLYAAVSHSVHLFRKQLEAHQQDAFLRKRVGTPIKKNKIIGLRIRGGSAIIPLDSGLVISYRLSIVTMLLCAAIWPQFATQVAYLGGVKIPVR